MTSRVEGSPFSQSYAEARAKFLAAARGAGAQVQSHVHALRGPAGEALATDVAWLGARDAAAVLMVVSGTHGVEGFCGSGALVDWLQRDEGARLGSGVSALLVHALNPHGFAWDRRVTEDNVDLNRNWIDFTAPLGDDAGFRPVAHLLDPPSWTEASLAAARSGLRALAVTQGPAAMVAAVSGGQHRHPRAVFFGGVAETWSRNTLCRIFETGLNRARHVGIVDLHSGLGPLGYGEVMVSAPPESAMHRRARAWYGAAVIPTGSAQSASAPIQGDWLGAAPGLLPRAVVTGVALEFGALPAMEVLDALLADSWLHNQDDPAPDAAMAVARKVRNAFYIDSDLWRGMVVGQSLAVLRQAAAGLASDLI